MLMTQLPLIILSAIIVWTTAKKENIPTTRSNSYEYTYTSRSGSLPRIDSSGSIPPCCLPPIPPCCLSSISKPLSRIEQSGTIPLCCLPKPSGNVTYQIRQTTRIYSYSGRKPIDADKINERLRTIMEQIPAPTVKFKSYYTSSPGITPEKPSSREFQQYETIESTLPHDTVSDKKSSESASYRRRSSYATPPLRSGYVIGPSRRSSATYNRPSRIMDSPGFDEDTEALNPQIEVIPSSKTREGEDKVDPIDIITDKIPSMDFF
ncbi:unnamed protein product [Onchocerca ochengi]|uniref:Clip domain-containing protein n=1 Tax=Onchocerca ochengi TaxID=42157 RepID=A0A182EJL9_ONCOC|nr:unnamed protein product [Onchocerca ochengi]